MFDSVLGRDIGQSSRFGSGTVISVLAHGLVLVAIAWFSTRAERHPSGSSVPVIKIFVPAQGSPATRSASEPSAIPKGNKRVKRLAQAAPRVEASEVARNPVGLTEVGQEDVPSGIGNRVGPEGSGTSDDAVGLVSTTVKTVPSFVFDRERVSAPDPHLPTALKDQHPHEQMRGLYRICVGTDGRVEQVNVISSIPGADHSIIEQIRDTWRYKPQPVPVCSIRSFVFNIK
jgi:protein TonB